MKTQFDWWNLINTIIALSLGLWATITTYRFNRFKKKTDRLNEMPYFKVENTSIPSTNEGTHFMTWDITLKNSGSDCFSFDLISETDLIVILKVMNKNLGIITNGDLITIRVSASLSKIMGEKKENILIFDIILKDKRSIFYIQNCKVSNIGQIEDNREVEVKPPILKK